MLVKQLMRRDCLTVLPDDSIQEAAEKMRERHVGVALVFEDEKFSGILTEDEIMNAIAANSDEISPAGMKKETVNADGDRCCYFNDVMIDLLVGK